MRRVKRAVAGVVVAAFALVGYTQTVQAAMIGTEQVLAATMISEERARIAAALERPEVIGHLEQLGVPKADAQARVAALSDEEATTLAGQIDSLPAGGDVVGALVLIFFVLLVTDILGLTKVFPFTRSRR
ncbi:MAG TPA: PA2779 family protein [Noviherbaspirillum sp.]